MIKKVENLHSSKIVYSVQILRGLAALFVVLFHISIMAEEKFNWVVKTIWGNAGVDIFFVISGFIMVYTATKKSGDISCATNFLKKRLLRIAPLYWLVSSAKLVLAYSLPNLFQRTVLEPLYVLASFAFIPTWHNRPDLLPLVPQGWTLSFEMLYYAVFACALAWSKKPVVMASLMLMILAITGAFFLPQDIALAPVIRPVILEFIFGMGIAKLFMQKKNLPTPVAIVLLLVSFVGILISNALPIEAGKNYRLLIWGVPSALILWSFLSLEKFFKGKAAKPFVLLGETSYSLYLTHGFVVPLVALGVKKLDAFPSQQACFLAALLALIGSIATGYASFRYLETPLHAWLVRKTSKPSTRNEA